MNRFKLDTKEEVREVMDKFIYPSQFKNEVGLIYHIINFCYPLLESDKTVGRFLDIYKKKNSRTALTNYHKIMENFIKDKSTIFRLECFTHLQEIIEPEDYIYLHGNKRYLTIKEIKYMIYRITQMIYKSKTGREIIYNNYFNSCGFKSDYEKNTGKKYGNRKFTNILKVLQKYKYLFVKKNEKKHNIYMIGKNNPYYQLIEVKDITVKDEIVKNSLEERIEKLETENAELKNMLEAYKNDYLEAKDIKKNGMNEIEGYKIGDEHSKESQLSIEF